MFCGRAEIALSGAMSKSYVRVGTQVPIPDDEEAVKRHIPVHEQKAVDERGRRRFHGAFTGGFSAGYARICRRLPLNALTQVLQHRRQQGRCAAELIELALIFAIDATAFCPRQNRALASCVLASCCHSNSILTHAVLGWAPSTFVSSRKKPAVVASEEGEDEAAPGPTREQMSRPEYYMDEVRARMRVLLSCWRAGGHVGERHCAASGLDQGRLCAALAGAASDQEAHWVARNSGRHRQARQRLCWCAVRAACSAGSGVHGAAGCCG